MFTAYFTKVYLVRPFLLLLLMSSCCGAFGERRAALEFEKCILQMTLIVSRFTYITGERNWFAFKTFHSEHHKLHRCMYPSPSPPLPPSHPRDLKDVMKKTPTSILLSSNILETCASKAKKKKKPFSR